MLALAATSREPSSPRPQTPPQGRELEILNEVKDQVPPEVFTTVHTNPVNNSPDDLRGNLRKAVSF